MECPPGGWNEHLHGLAPGAGLTAGSSGQQLAGRVGTRQLTIRENRSLTADLGRAQVVCHLLRAAHIGHSLTLKLLEDQRFLTLIGWVTNPLGSPLNLTASPSNECSYTFHSNFRATTAPKLTTPVLVCMDSFLNLILLTFRRPPRPPHVGLLPVPGAQSFEPGLPVQYLCWREDSVSPSVKWGKITYLLESFQGLNERVRRAACGGACGGRGLQRARRKPPQQPPELRGCLHGSP